MFFQLGNLETEDFDMTMFFKFTESICQRGRKCSPIEEFQVLCIKLVDVKAASDNQFVMMHSGVDNVSFPASIQECAYNLVYLKLRVYLYSHWIRC